MSCQVRRYAKPFKLSKHILEAVGELALKNGFIKFLKPSNPTKHYHITIKNLMLSTLNSNHLFHYAKLILY